MACKNVPFFANPDSTHCYQAAIKMAVKYFLPNANYSWDELDVVTAKKPGLWTWPLAGILWLKSLELDAYIVSNFDYDRFVALGADYLIEYSGKEVGDAQIANSDIAQERRFAKQACKTELIKHRVPKIEELCKILDRGYLLICNVNSRALNGRPGYIGHFVLVYDYTDDSLLLHDPGPMPKPSRTVPFNVFENAWAYPDKNAKDYIAIKHSI